MPKGLFEVAELDGYVTINAANIVSVANQTGVSALAIATAIGREINNKTYDQPWHIAFDALLKQPNIFLDQNIKITQEIATLPHDGPISSSLDRYDNYALRDVGPGKIQIRTAIHLLEDYLYANPLDPLGLAQYSNDYGLYASKLADWSSDVSVTVAGLMIQKAQLFFSSNISDWNAWSTVDRDASLVAYYSRGESVIVRALNNAAADGTDARLAIHRANTGEDFAVLLGSNKDVVLGALARGVGNATGPQQSTYGVDINYAKMNYWFGPNIPQAPEQFVRSFIKCFASGTPIRMADGRPQAIETLNVGDYVASFSTVTPAADTPLRSAKVVRIHQASAPELIVLSTGLRVTPTHRMLRPDGTFMPIRDIVALDGLVVSEHGQTEFVNGRIISAADATSEEHLGKFDICPRSGEFRIYNITVEDNHTYVAGGLRVHNECVFSTELLDGFVVSDDGRSLVFRVIDSLTRQKSEIVERVSETPDHPTYVQRKTYFADNNPSYVTTSWNQFDSAGQPTGPAQVGLTWKVANGTSFDDPNIYTGPFGATAVQWNHTIVGGHDAYSMQFVDVNQNPLLSITAKPDPQQPALMTVALTEYADGQPTAIGNIDYSNSSNDPFKQATFKNAITGQIIEREIETQDGTSVQNDTSGTSVTLPLNNSPAVGRWNTEVQPEDHTYSLVGDQIGAVLGSTLGQVLAGHASGGEQAFARIAGNTALAIVLGTVGRSLDSYFNDGSATNGDFSASVGLALDHVGTTFGSALRTAGTGFIASFLTAELAESLHIDATSFGGALFSYATNTAVSGVLNAALVNLNLGLDVTAGFGGNLFSGAGVGSFLGGYLARQVVAPENLGGSLGASIGGILGTAAVTVLGGGTAIIGSVASVIGEALGAILIPGVGAFFGAVIGTLIGNYLGGVFGGEGDSFYGNYAATLDPLTGQYVSQQGGYQRANLSGIASLANNSATILNGFLSLVGGRAIAGHDAAYYMGRSLSGGITTSTLPRTVAAR